VSSEPPASGELIDRAGELYDRAARLALPLRRRRVVMALGWGVGIVLVLAIAAFINRGTSSPKDPRLLAPDAAAPSGKVKGFDEVAVRARPASAAPGSPATKVSCHLLATTPKQQARGLMGMTTLSGYDGMVFAFRADTETPFYMRNTPLPLSIAWFNSQGVFMGSADMAPCANTGGCPVTKPPGPYRVAIEAQQGVLPEIGLINGSAISVGGPCPLSQ
jgi:uncharacterized membrane protein (UPF0127 family)